MSMFCVSVSLLLPSALSYYLGVAGCRCSIFAQLHIQLNHKCCQGESSTETKLFHRLRTRKGIVLTSKQGKMWRNNKSYTKRWDKSSWFNHCNSSYNIGPHGTWYWYVMREISKGQQGGKCIAQVSVFGNILRHKVRVLRRRDKYICCVRLGGVRSA